MIQVSGLSRRYGKALAVDDVSFLVPAGQMLALVGESGAGKTTTLKMINRLVEPHAGRVFIDCHDIRTVEPYALRRSIGYVFEAAALFPHLTLAGNIGVPLALLGWSPERIAARVAELLELLELEQRLGARLPDAVSRVEQQRASLARALAAAPRVVLLDEPWSALDPLNRELLQRSFDGLRRRLGFTVVLATQDMRDAALLADSIGVLRAGRLVQLGAPLEIARQPADEGVARQIELPRSQARLVAERLGGGG